MKKILSILCALMFTSVLVQAQNSHWSFDYAQYQYDMTVYATLSESGETPADINNYQVAAFVGDECRGVATAPANGIFTLRVYSNQSNGEDVTFRVYDVRHYFEYTEVDAETLKFSSQSIVGRPSTPVVLSFETAEFPDLYDWISSNHGQPNSISEVTYNFTAEAGQYLNFNWSVSSESSCDKLSIYLNGNQVLFEVSGEQSGFLSLPVREGENVLNAYYSKDGSVDHYNDEARLWGFSLGEQIIVEKDWYLAGTMNGWRLTHMDNGTISYTLEPGTHEFKIVDAPDWGGYELYDVDYSSTNVELYVNAAYLQNISFYLSERSDVTFTVVNSRISVWAETKWVEDEPNVLYALDASGKCGQTIDFCVCMNNSEPATAFQFDLELPWGLSLAQFDDETYQVYKINNRFAYKNHTVYVRHLNENTYRIVCASRDNSLIDGNDGPVLAVVLNVDDNCSEGINRVYLTNQVITQQNTQCAYYESSYADIDISSGTLGDVNRDGEITTGDYVGVQNMILGCDCEELNYNVADVNFDGRINAGDCVGIINYILYGYFVPEEARSMAGSDYASVVLSNINIFGGETAEMALSLSNPTCDFTALQFNLRLPEGISLQKVRWTDRTDSEQHSIRVVEQADGSYRFVCSSGQNATFFGSEGDLMILTLAASDAINSGSEIEVTDVQLAKTNTSVITADSAKALVNADATGIDTVNNEQLTMNNSVYNIAGQKVNKTHKGIYVINGKKQIK